MQKIRDSEVLNPRGTPVSHPSSYASRIIKEEGGGKTEEWWVTMREQCPPDAAGWVHTGTQQLCQHAQDPWKSKLDQIPAWKGEVGMKFYSWQHSSWQLIAPGRGENQFSLNVVVCHSPVECHASKNIYAAQVGLDGFKTKTKRKQNWTGKEGVDLGGVGVNMIKTHYTKFSKNQ